jgi:hypothetical protein
VSPSIRRRASTVRIGLVALALCLAGCSESGGDEVERYEPSDVEEIEGSDLKRVVFTQIGADALGLRTTTATQSGPHTAVDYEALIYDGQGLPWVYTVPEELTFVRAQVVVDRVEGDQVLLSGGLSPGTRVVTTGASEVYGSELNIEGSH